MEEESDSDDDGEWEREEVGMELEERDDDLQDEDDEMSDEGVEGEQEMMDVEQNEVEEDDREDIEQKAAEKCTEEEGILEIAQAGKQELFIVNMDVLKMKICRKK